MITPLVSIIIPTYNRAHIISETINSVLAQTYQNWECIIVDDGSSDYTEDIVAKYYFDPRIRFFQRPAERIKGSNSCRNYGIEKSLGQFIMFLDSDDWLLPDHFLKKIHVLRNNHQIDGILSKTIMVNNNKEVIKKEFRTVLTDNLLEDFISLKVSWYIHDVLWRKSFLKDKVLYDENLMKMQDRDFHIRRLIEEPTLSLCDEYLTLYRVHENSKSVDSDYKVAESRHNAILQIIDYLEQEGKLSITIKNYLFKHQVQNLIILYQHPKCFELYLNLIDKTFNWSVLYFKWLTKFYIGYISFKLTKRGLRFIQ